MENAKSFRVFRCPKCSNESAGRSALKSQSSIFCRKCTEWFKIGENVHEMSDDELETRITMLELKRVT